MQLCVPIEIPDNSSAVGWATYDNTEWPAHNYVRNSARMRKEILFRSSDIQTDLNEKYIKH